MKPETLALKVPTLEGIGGAALYMIEKYGDQGLVVLGVNNGEAGFSSLTTSALLDNFQSSDADVSATVQTGRVGHELLGSTGTTQTVSNNTVTVSFKDAALTLRVWKDGVVTRAVLYDIGRQPRAAREFFIEYQDRVLFGKDSYAPTEFPYYWRVFETDDEYFDYYRDYHATWKLYGMDLPDEVLKKVYYKNSLRVTPGLPKAGFPE